MAPDLDHDQEVGREAAGNRDYLLIAHGAADDSIPFTESQRRAEAARARALVRFSGPSTTSAPTPSGARWCP